MWETLANALLLFIEEWGEAAIFLIILLEESGVPLPLPGDLVLIWGGYRVAHGMSNIFGVILIVELATLIGASTLYWLASRGGRPLIMRYGRFLHLDADKLDRAEHWVRGNAVQAIILGRIVPGFRIATPLAAGVFNVPYRVFLPSLAAGALIYGTFWVMIGVIFRPSVIGFLHTPRLTARIIWSLILLVLLGLLTWRIRSLVLPRWREQAFHISRRRHVEAAALAGLVASFEMASAVGVILTALAELHVDLPEHALLRVVALVGSGHGSPLQQAFAPVAILLLSLSGIAWAVAYALYFEPLLHTRFGEPPDWIKGVLFSVIPTLTSWFLLLPLLGAGVMGLGLEAGFVPAAGELLRHLLYGAALGLAYPILLLARMPWHPKAPDQPRELTATTAD